MYIYIYIHIIIYNRLSNPIITSNQPRPIQDPPGRFVGSFDGAGLLQRRYHWPGLAPGPAVAPTYGRAGGKLGETGENLGKC